MRPEAAEVEAEAEAEVEAEAGAAVETDVEAEAEAGGLVKLLSATTEATARTTLQRAKTS